MQAITQNHLKITGRYIVWSSVGVLIPLFLIYLFNGNILKFQFLIFLVQLAVLGYFSFKTIYDVRMSSDDQKLHFLNAWLYVFLLLTTTLLIFLLVKLMLFFLIDPTYLDSCIEQVKLDFIALAEKNALFENFDLEKFDEIKQIKTYTYYVWYYSLKSFLLLLLIALVAKKK